MCHISGSSDKSLLLQTVALFETLMSKIKDLQDENAKIKSDYNDLSHSQTLKLEDITKIHADRDQLVLELEESRNKLNNANQVRIRLEKICKKRLSLVICDIGPKNIFYNYKSVSFNFQTIVQLTDSTNSHEDQVKSLTTDLSRMDAKNAQLQSIHLKQESDLKKHISDLKSKLDSATYGRREESEMYEEAMVKTQRLETIVNELNAKVISKFGIKGILMKTAL